MIFDRRPDGSVLVDRETLTATTGLPEHTIRRHCTVVGYRDDPTVADRRHRRRAVYDLDAAQAALDTRRPHRAA